MTCLALNAAAPLLMLSLCIVPPVPQPPGPEPPPGPTAEGLVTELYGLVTFEAGREPDWNQVRGLFIPEAVIVLRTSREQTSIFSVDEFVKDFVTFIERANARETGFSERIIRMRSTVFGDMAHVLVLYEASIPGSPRPPQQGVDSFLLTRKDDQWRIVAVTNEVPAPGRPLPPELRG
jgi:hypothetical protein